MKPIFAIKDRAINGYNDIFAAPSTQHAIRSFRDEANSDKTRSVVAKHPDDYDLYLLGNYHEETGIIEPEQQPQLIARAKDLLNQDNQT